MTQAEVETTLRFDHEERVLWACTTDAATAARWRRHGLDVHVIGRVKGEAASWQVKLPATARGWRQAWRQTLVWAIPGWPSYGPGAGQAPSAAGDMADEPREAG